VRQLAREIGVNIAQVPGAGPRRSHFHPRNVKKYAKQLLMGATGRRRLGIGRRVARFLEMGIRDARTHEHRATENGRAYGAGMDDDSARHTSSTGQTSRISMSAEKSWRQKSKSPARSSP